MSIHHAIKWSFLSEVATKVVTPLVFVILARLLTPEDYGVVAAATMVVSFSQIFWEAGMGKAVIQYQGERVTAANTAFWINNLLGLVVAGLLVAMAPMVADKLFHDPRVALVLKVMAVQVLLSAAGSVHTALMQKDMQFKRLFWVRLLTVSAPGLISIPLALRGMGYWALVAGSLVGQTLQLVALWRISDWRPAFAFDSASARRLVGFGSWVAMSGLLGWFYMWADSLIVGMYLGSHELGLYRTGNTFVMMLYGILFGPLLPVLYSHLAGIQEDRTRITQLLGRIFRLITFISVPAGFLLYTLAEPIARIVFGPNWLGIGLVISMMGLTHGFAWIVGANGEAYRAIGKPDYETKIMASTLLLYSFAYWVSIQYGLTTFLWTRFGVALLAISIHFRVAHAAIGLPFSRSVLYLARVAALGIPLVWLERTQALTGEGGLLRLALAATAALAWVGAYLWWIERKSLIPEALNLIRRKAVL